MIWNLDALCLCHPFHFSEVARRFISQEEIGEENENQTRVWWCTPGMVWCSVLLSMNFDCISDLSPWLNDILWYYCCCWIIFHSSFSFFCKAQKNSYTRLRHKCRDRMTLCHFFHPWNQRWTENICKYSQVCFDHYYAAYKQTIQLPWITFEFYRTFRHHSRTHRF